MASEARVGDSFLERVTSMQQRMHQREKQRIQLEKQLFSYSKPNNKRISHIKGYLKQICVREAQAKMRNLELLRDVECLQISMQEYTPDFFPLQQQKAEFASKIARFIEEMKTTGKEKLKPTQRNCKDSSVLHIEDDFTKAPAVISMGRQTKGSRILSHQTLHRSPKRSTHSLERPPSGLLKDSEVVREDAAVNQAHLSDDNSASDNSSDGCNLRDKHTKMSVTPQYSCATTIVPGNMLFANEDGQEPAPLVTLKSPQRNLSLGSSNKSMKLKNPPAEYANSGEIAPQAPLKGDLGRGFSHLMPETSGRKEVMNAQGISRSISLSSDAQLSESSVSDLSISLTQSEPEEDDHPESEGSWCGLVTTFKSNGSKKTPHNRCDRLSLEGLFKLLDSIECRIHGEQTRVYGGSSFDERHLIRIISLCDSGLGLNEEDLEACGAVVLHELQGLSWSTTKGCLLTQELVSAHQPTAEHITIRLPPDAAQLWDRWFKHALLLKESRVLSTERLVELFTPLLVERHATYSHQAEVLLRTLLTQSSEECPSADDESDSSSSSSSLSSCGPLFHRGAVKPAGQIQKQQIKELQSAEEDNQDESPVESVPIRETKAYQLLKLSAMQEQLQSSEDEEEENGEEDDFSGINHGYEVDLGRAKRYSDQDPYSRKDKVNPKIYSALQSSAFWGESDDNNSDIEAALCPQPFNRNDSDDTDDFYD
ncbi:centrosomal protein kizuna isoform X1 [Nerophis lumbriciformis]|uniref:centrosomal protein kizuna isoform X1 n=1 Tax=Nerophis lumbriciformis TaxID=546530 RepID=UPI003BAC801D